MADPHGKRKYAGPTPAELRKTGEDAVIDIRKLPPHKQARDYILEVVTTTTCVEIETHKFKTKAQLEQFEIDAKKKHEGVRKTRRYYGLFGREYTSKLEFKRTFP